MERVSSRDGTTQWELARAGDESAFGAIFDAHRDRVFRHAYRFVADRHDAEDVLATTFLELWRRRDTVGLVDGSVLPWLLVTASNTALSSRRARQRYQKLLGRIPHDEALPSAEEEAFARQETLDSRLREALHRLRDIDRGLVALVMLEGYPTAEAAAALGITPGTARTRLSRVRTRLRLELSPTSAPALPTEEASL
jgi:RNA polymerase sigma-70 factor (ECF subfamily)